MKMWGFFIYMIKITSNMIDTTVRRLLVGGNEEDFKVGAALIAKKGVVQEGLYAFEDVELWTKRMHLDKVKWLQEKYPNLIVSGSIALFLHGCRSKRWEASFFSPDIDLILPFFFPIEGEKIKEYWEEHHASGSDFQEVYNYDGIKLDTRIDANQRWEHIKYDGFNYKVSDPLDIIQAKIKYSKQGNSNSGKHREDLYDFIGKTIFKEYLNKVEVTKEMEF